MLDLTIKKISKSLVFIMPFITATTTYADDYPIVSGSFFMATVTSETIELTPGSNTGVLTEGVYQGTSLSPTNQALFAPFQFFGNPVGTYTAQTGVDNGTHSAPSLNLVTGIADMSSFYAFWNGTEFNQGNSTAAIVDNFDGTYTLSWESLIVGGPFDGKTGSWVMVVECPNCPESESGPAVDLTAVQDGVTTRTVTQADGTVNISTDLTSTTGYLFNWSDTSDELDNGSITTTPGFSFDPATVDIGAYSVTVRVTNNNTTPVQKSLSTLIINVVESGTLSEIGDNDNDGVANAYDGISDATQLQGEAGNNSTYVLASSDGKLVVGDVAACVSSNSAAVTLNQIKNNAASACGVTDKAADDVFSVTTGIGGYYNFQVRNVARGSTVDVVVPLNTALPKNAGIRKFNNSQSPAWSAFNTQGSDAVASASSSQAGVCPAADSSSWQAGLKQGDECIRLSITDAGANDADGLSDGVINLTSTVIGYDGINTDLQEGCSMSGNHSELRHHLEWIMIGLFLFGLSLKARLNRQV